MSRNKFFILIGAGVALIVLVIAGILFFSRGDREQGRGTGSGGRVNTLTLAGDYIAQGEYQRALDLLDRLLIEDSGDDEARALRDRAIAASHAAGSGAAGSAAAGTGAAGSGAANSGEGASLAAAAEAFREAVSRLPPGGASGGGTSGASGGASGGTGDAEARAVAEAERRAAQEALAERRRAEEAELAKKSQELQAQMRAVNDLVSQGRSALERNNYPQAAEAFKEAVSRLPSGEPRFGAQKYAEIGDVYYEGYARNPDGPESGNLLNESISHSREAIQRDSGQALPHYTLGKINRDLQQWDNAITELREAVRLDPNH
jgi:tetratricopeptide (TPR) repeat protein